MEIFVFICFISFFVRNNRRTTYYVQFCQTRNIDLFLRFAVLGYNSRSATIWTGLSNDGKVLLNPLFPGGRYCSALRGILFSGILRTCWFHFSWSFWISSMISSTLHLFLISSLLILSLKVTPLKVRKNLICELFILDLSLWWRVQHSLPHRNAGFETLL